MPGHSIVLVMYNYHDEKSRMTTTATLTAEKEDTIFTLIVVVIGVIVAIIILFSMGVFLDCRHQKHNANNNKPLRMKAPTLARKKKRMDDEKSLASDMFPSGLTDYGAGALDVVV
ncbi:uncharacterized protein LOC103569767 isoform X2 [Microplitis demolitor]|uniref:uncharacterized protein LOC103569767 isoform X2 n=1 Tax=Microplitis demolitor TaxID=69319 RepID=UPI0004CD63A3|nr:uncharacterized protein LOC103569767 isoform X2 [Microplitis demolitor]